MKQKGIGAIKLALFLTIGLFSVLFFFVTAREAEAATAGGVTWYVEGEVLHVEGTGSMFDVAEGGQAPWYPVRSTVTEIVLGDGLTSVGERAFYGFSRVSRVTLPKNVKSIGAHAFSGCTALSSLQFPSELVHVGEGAFLSCVSLTEVTLPNGCLTVGAYAFASCENLRVAHLPASLTELGAYAFFGARRLQEIQLPPTVTSVPEACFRGCAELSAVSLPSGLLKVEKEAFYGCERLTAVVLPIGIKEIGASAFWGSGLLGISLPNGLEGLGEYAFAYCRSLAEACLPDSLTDIPTGLFLSAERLREITLPLAAEAIGDRAFSYCLSLGSIKLPARLRSIGKQAFSHNTALKKVDFCATACFVAGTEEEPVFEGCVNLEEIRFASDVTLVPPALCYGLPALSSVSLPDSVREIGASAFEGCAALAEVDLGEGVGRVGENAFYRCPYLTALAVPASLRTAGRYAFYTSEEGRLFLELPSAESGFHPDFSGRTAVLWSGAWVKCTFVAKGEVLKTLYLATGEVCQPPRVPNDTSKFGYTGYFNGWDLNGDGKADTLPIETHGSFLAEALYREQPNRYQCRFYLEDGTLYAELSADYGKAVPLPTPPTKDSDGTYRYLFSGWRGYAEGIQVSGDMHFTANFSRQLLDKEPPAITGIAKGEQYHAERNVTVTDSGMLVSVRLDGKELYPNGGDSLTFTLPTDGKSHTLIAVDSAGNKTELTFRSVDVAALIKKLFSIDKVALGAEKEMQSALEAVDAALSATDLLNKDRDSLTAYRTALLAAYGQLVWEDAFSLSIAEGALPKGLALKEKLKGLFGEEEILLALNGKKVRFDVSVYALRETERQTVEKMLTERGKTLANAYGLAVTRTVTDTAENTIAEETVDVELPIESAAFLDRGEGWETSFLLLTLNGEATLYEKSALEQEGKMILLSTGTAWAYAEENAGIGKTVFLLITLGVALATTALIGAGAWLFVKHRAGSFKKTVLLPAIAGKEDFEGAVDAPADLRYTNDGDDDDDDEDGIMEVTDQEEYGEDATEDENADDEYKENGEKSENEKTWQEEDGLDGEI